MITSLERFAELGNTSTGEIESERDFIRDALEVLRGTGEISNDAFLDAGTIQGGLSLMLNLINQGISNDEAQNQLNSLKIRANSLEDKYPGLDEKIESIRK
ncbi:MAG: hypothetical protein QGF32_02865 [Candidatus Thalassarchaeaceae archaeon]|jgi:hypothetical protein|nr:hypothetical protein [Candidatus Thalassarchaeaceae archaeon]|tara:strand:- start:6233 stop:6535 length:303 start_codon:yes stop_codon:yes gene_type:complete